MNPEETPEELKAETPAAASAAEKGAKTADPHAGRIDLYFWLQTLVMALVTLILVFTFVGRIIGVDGLSMYPTLNHRDMLLLQTIGYTPKQGDVVVATKKDFREGKPVVKRVIATGGQTVDIDYAANTVSVDGAVLDEPYLGEPMYNPSQETVTHAQVPVGSVFVMGDNRNNSTDSRFPELGFIDQREVLGRAFFILLPPTHLGGL
ncbi:MAG: signal peptidase I [Oscillospiraceae bacterium]